MKGEKHYPKDVSAAFKYLSNYQGNRRNVKFKSEELYFKNTESKKTTEVNVD